MDKKEYVEYVLRNNGFLKNELLYYMGCTGKNPHGISDYIWNIVCNQIGFNLQNLELINDKYFLKEQ